MNDFCQLCGHHHSWHIMSGACFCEYIEDCSGEECKFIKKPCWCPDYTEDWTQADKIYKQLKERGKV